MDLIFDLDGTLVDTRPGIQHALRQAVRQVFPGLDLAGFEFKIGPPVREVIEQGLKTTRPEELDQLEAAFRGCYDTEGWKMSSLYPGVLETLEQLRQRGNSLYIATYKPGSVTKRILTYHHLLPFFDEVISPDSRQPKFVDKEEEICYLMDQHNLSRQNTVYLGDSPEDMSAAEVCGISFLGLEYGYGMFSSPVLLGRLVRSFPELLSKVTNQARGTGTNHEGRPV